MMLLVVLLLVLLVMRMVLLVVRMMRMVRMRIVFSVAVAMLNQFTFLVVFHFVVVVQRRPTPSQVSGHCRMSYNQSQVLRIAVVFVLLLSGRAKRSMITRFSQRVTVSRSGSSTTCTLLLLFRQSVMLLLLL